RGPSGRDVSREELGPSDRSVDALDILEDELVSGDFIHAEPPPRALFGSEKTMLLPPPPANEATSSMSSDKRSRTRSPLTPSAPWILRQTARRPQYVRTPQPIISLRVTGGMIAQPLGGSRPFSVTSAPSGGHTPRLVRKPNTKRSGAICDNFCCKRVCPMRM